MWRNISVCVLFTLCLALLAGYQHLSLTAGIKASFAGDSSRLVYRADHAEKVVALSFDDGPEPSYTLPALHTLAQKGARATFFVVGSQAAKHPDIILEMTRQGHEVANHTWSHPDMNEVTTGELVNEVKATNQLIEGLTGDKNIYFRPPKGIIGPEGRKALFGEGCQIVMWSICIESREVLNPREMAQRVLDQVSPGQIILLHDGRLDRTKTIQALPFLLDGLKEKGYRAVTVGELLYNN
ncbi:MAG: hypothetical protein JL50_18725 [Peptococcaceae bacterium BICA1-7]|nr:MAG: hypothetical protein JL50_18725 [Peptococcaceae bacterium BICA1-7]HBV99029.1 polysaccharide deacetylase family protein [Desulfotomaculum sp.]